LEFLQSMVALTDLYIPQVASYNKQNGEIELLLKSAPVPNAKFQQAEQGIGRFAQAGVPPMALAQAKDQLSKIPPAESSVPIDPFDDDATEAFTCWKWMTSPEGRKTKRLNPLGFQNVLLHWQEHNTALAQKNQGNAAQQKPPSKSMALKDMVGTERAQLLAQGGIQADAQAEAMDQA